MLVIYLPARRRGGGDLDGHLVTGGGELRGGISDAVGLAHLDGGFGGLAGTRCAHAGSDLDRGQLRVHVVGEGNLDGLEALDGDLGAVGIGNPVLDALTREHRVAVVDVATGGNLLGQGDHGAIRDVVESFEGAVGLRRQLAERPGQGTDGRVGGVAGDLATHDRLLHGEMPDGVTGTRTTT